jgi:hypothetical protein
MSNYSRLVAETLYANATNDNGKDPTPPADVQVEKKPTALQRLNSAMLAMSARSFVLKISNKRYGALNDHKLAPSTIPPGRSLIEIAANHEIFNNIHRKQLGQ